MHESDRRLVSPCLRSLRSSACGSSKPDYCSSRTNLENSVKGLASLNASSGISGLKAQLGKIQSDVNTLVSQAKSDFPSQTSALKSSVDSSQQRHQRAVGNSLRQPDRCPGHERVERRDLGQELVDATSSKCS